MQGTGDPGRREIRGNYLIAADGGHSRVRTALGVDYEGRGAFSNSLTIYFTANLSPYIGGKAYSLIYVNNATLRGFFRLNRRRHGRFPGSKRHRRPGARPRGSRECSCRCSDAAQWGFWREYRHPRYAQSCREARPRHQRTCGAGAPRHLRDGTQASRCVYRSAASLAVCRSTLTAWDVTWQTPRTDSRAPMGFRVRGPHSSVLTDSSHGIARKAWSVEREGRVDVRGVLSPTGCPPAGRARWKT